MLQPPLPVPAPSHPPQAAVSGAPVSKAAALDAARRWQLQAGESSREQYGRTLCRFESFCSARGVASRPSCPSTVASYLRERGEADGLQRDALKADAAAIRRAHKACGLPDPTDDPEVRAALGIKRRFRPYLPTASALQALARGLPAEAAAVDVALPPPEVAVPGEAPLSLEQLDAIALQYKRKALARGTQNNYASALDDYLAFCDRHGLDPVPATQQTVCRFLAEYGSTRGTSSLKTARSAIRWIHRKDNQLSPTDCQEVEDLIKGHARLWGKTRGQKHALSSDEIAELCRAMDEQGGIHAIRDKAMTLLGYAGAFRRSEYTCRDVHDDEDLFIFLDLKDLSFNRYGVEVRLRKSKTDQTGEGQYVFITYGTRKETCAVLALRNWIELMKARGITTGPVFRPLYPRGDRLIGDAEIVDRPLTPAAFVLRLKHWAELIGMDPAKIGGHSLRAGHVTAASLGGASIFSIALQGRWKDLRTILIYHRRATAHIDNSSSALGL
jgi:integrase